MISDSITDAYSQSGGDLPYFVGKQYGSGWLRTLARVAFPILKRVVSVAGRTADDVINSNKDWSTSLKNNALEAVGDVVGNAVGSTINSVREQPTNNHKRPASSSTSTSVPPLFKRRRFRR